ncbi:putative ATP-dependent RNA helicase DHR1 [Sporothrix bragantina]|uniref:ATP-dependent RNA helicase DHR1 n=1 Tax=Sporothrix bragantina TaxID=671064 RepID=A0ABP0B9U8_9PEZI
MPAPKKFVPRQRKHKARAREAREADEHANANGGAFGGDAMAVDSNVAEILPEEQRARNEKKAQLRAELRAGQASQMSAKKAKRLEKYIETKLRKDESRELNDKLAAKSIDPAIFESSRDLGKGKKRRRAEMEKQRSTRKDEGSEDDSGTDVDEEEAKEEVKVAQKTAAQSKKATQPAAAEADKTNKVAAPSSETKPVAPAPTPTPSTGSSLFGSAAVTVGSGLKRPLNLDEDGRPILKKRQKRGGVKSKFEVETVERAPVKIVIEKKREELTEDDSDEWGGLSDDGEDEEKAESGSDEESDTSGEAEEEDDENVDDDDDEEDEDEDDESESDDSDDSQEESSPRPSGFKSWAMAQRDEALGFKPTTGETTSMYSFPTVENFEPRPIEAEPLPISLRPTKRLDRKAFHVDVLRTPEVEAARLNLPVVAEEQQIIEAIHEHDVVILSGGTGSGKTTQVPQFLYEAGFGSPDSDYSGMIGVTQPRRVAAVSMAKRVAEELGEAHGRAVAYQIRFESNVSKDTAIKFMTDGVLLRELSEDVALRKYSAVVIDEAHERSINTDVLIGIVSRINTIRAELNVLHASSQAKPMKPLKIIIMSATLQIKAFVANRDLFKEKPRMIHVEGRQFPVTVHFAQHTRHDYVDEAFRKIVRGHRKLPPGGFLVFLTGEDEIQRLAKRLHLEINGVRAASKPKVRVSTTEMAYETEDIEFGSGLGDENGNDAKYLEGEEVGRRKGGKNDGEEEEEQDDYDYDNDEEEDEGEFVPDEGETAGSGPKLVHILPLFSKLSTKDQQRVFQPAPDGARQVILATNVAETSLTIPGVRYVFDCGRAKARTFNKQTGVQSFEIGWISKASASQRSGRAGRTGPGHCYRLYSSAVYEENFEEFSEPEILRMPIEGVVLQLKSMHVPHVSRFPFPTAPDADSLKRADRLLMYLAAVSPLDDARGSSGDRSTVTKLGELMSAFPLSPRFAKILMVGHPGDCIHYVIALVAAMSADEVFVRPNNAIPAASATAKSNKGGGDDGGEDEDEDKPRQIRTQADIKQDEARRRTAELFRKVHKQFTSLDDKSDALKLLQVIGEFSHEPTEDWCKGHFVHYKALREVQKMRRQITALLRTNLPIHAAANLTYQEQLPRPTDTQVRLLKQMVAAGYPENIAQRADMTPNPPQYITSGGTVHKPRRAIEVPYRPLFPLLGDDKTPGSEFVYIHPSSPMAHLTVAECPQYIVYSHLQRAAPNPDMDASVSLPKVRMRSLVDLSGLQLASLLQGTPLLSYGKPIKETFRSDDGRERECWVVPELSADVGVGGVGWPLPAIKVRQRKEPGQGWEVIARK